MVSRRTAGAKARAASPLSTPPLSLSVNDTLFLNEYFRNGRNATQAYLAVHPAVKYTSAEAAGCRLLTTAKVQAEIARRVRYDVGITKEWGASKLLFVCEQAEALKDYALLSSTVMDAMKLAGFLVEKREVKTVTEEQRSALRDLVSRCLPPPSSTTRMRTSVEESPPIMSVTATVSPSAGTG